MIFWRRVKFHFHSKNLKTQKLKYLTAKTGNKIEDFPASFYTPDLPLETQKSKRQEEAKEERKGREESQKLKGVARKGWKQQTLKITWHTENGGSWSGQSQMKIKERWSMQRERERTEKTRKEKMKRLKGEPEWMHACMLTDDKCTVLFSLTRVDSSTFLLIQNQNQT